MLLRIVIVLVAISLVSVILITASPDLDADRLMRCRMLLESVDLD